MRLIASVFLLVLSLPSPAQVINLSGSWKFHVDDDKKWASPKFDDSGWEFIQAPSPWEEQGFNGYDGFAWYRRQFDGRKLDKNDNYYLGLGFIDDCDEVYVNGNLVGFSGMMPPHFKTAFNTQRKYTLTNDVINFSGMNTIAIRVFDVTNAGGLIEGDIGVFRFQKNKSLLIDLQGIWSFATSWSSERIKLESEWKRIIVPGEWEHQGYYNYDGYAWYRRTFSVPADFPKEDLVLLLGKIDDFDKTYLNGQLIGATNDHHRFGSSGSYQKKRAYGIPPEILKRGATNTIEVLVEDMGNIGGIYEGPVGIARKSFIRDFHFD